MISTRNLTALPTVEKLKMLTQSLAMLDAIKTPSKTASVSPTALRPLGIVQTFKLPPTINGHFDHFTVDARQHRMFAASVDHKALLVLDTNTGKVLESIPMEVPRAIVYRGDLNRIYVSEGREGALRIYNGKTYKLLKSVKLLVDADPIVYDPSTKYIYVVNGGQKSQSKLLSN